jgi:hypothetical protein
MEIQRPDAVVIDLFEPACDDPFINSHVAFLDRHPVVRITREFVELPADRRDDVTFGRRVIPSDQNLITNVVFTIIKLFGLEGNFI